MAPAVGGQDMKIGILSDTHGQLRADAFEALKKADHILHAGDVGDPDVLETLKRIAPLSCVRGNMDGGAWSQSLPSSDLVELCGKVIYMVHDLYTIDIDPAAAGVEVIVSGHTHQPEIRTVRGILYLNPGSASYGRYASPPSIGWAEISNGRIRPRIVTLSS